MNEQTRKEPLFKSTPKGIILNLQQRTVDDLPLGIWFNKLTARKTGHQFVKIQQTYLVKKADGSFERVFVEPATLCSLKAFETLLSELYKIKRE